MGDSDAILITGANGFLGSEIVRQALQSGRRVRATDRDADSKIPEVDYCPADILSPSSLLPVTRGTEQVIHVAGLAHVFSKAADQAGQFMAVNEGGTANVVQAAANAGIRHLVLVSSVAVYGAKASGCNEESECRPEGPYAESKWRAERRALEIARLSRMHLTILRLATVYGEGDPGNVGRLIRMIDRGRFVWVGTGLNKKCLIHREDAARACVAALSQVDNDPKTYNVSSSAQTMRYVVDTIASALGRRLPPFRVPPFLAFALAELADAGSNRRRALRTTLEKWLADDVYNCDQFEHAFGRRMQVSLHDGLQREVAWYRGHLAASEGMAAPSKIGQ